MLAFRKTLVLCVVLTLTLPAVSAHPHLPGPSAFVLLAHGVACTGLQLVNSSFCAKSAGGGPSGCRTDCFVLQPPPQKRALFEHPIDLSCAAGFRASLDFLVPDAPLPGRVGVLDFTRAGQSVAHFSMLTPDRIYVGPRDAPYSMADSIAIAPGVWHTLNVTMSGSLMLVEIDDQPARSFAPLSAFLPDHVALTVTFNATGTPPQLLFERLEIVPTLERATDTLDVVWPTFGHRSSSEYARLSSSLARSAPTSLEVKTVVSVPDNPHEFGAWTDLRFPECAMPGIFRTSASIWFNIPEVEVWGTGQFALLQLGHGAPSSHIPMVVRIGDSDGDRILDVEQDINEFDPRDPPSWGTHVSTGRAIPFGGWHQLRVDERPAGDVLDMARIRDAEFGMWDSGLPLVIDLYLDGELVGTYPIDTWPGREHPRPLAVGVGLTDLWPGQADWFHVYWDDLEVSMDYAAPTCGTAVRKFRDPATEMGFASMYVESDATVVSATLDDGSGPRPIALGESLPVTFPGDGIHDVWQNLTLSDGRVLADRCPVVIDSVPPETSTTLISCIIDCEVWVPPTAGENGWLRSPTLLGFQVNDPLSGVASCAFEFVANPGWMACEPTWLSEGVHSLRYYSVDEVGNVEAPKSSTIKLDTVAPAPQFTGVGLVGEAGWSIGPVDVTLAATDATSGVASGTYALDGAAAQPYFGPFRILADGAHTVTSRWKDLAGNEGAQTYSIPIDSTPPAVSAVVTSGTPGDNGWYRSAVTARLTLSDATSGIRDAQWSMAPGDAGTMGAGTQTFSFTTDAHGGLTYQAHDHAGLLARGHLPVNIDRVAPSTIATPSVAPASTGWTHAAAIDVALLSTDATSGIAGTFYRLDGGPWTESAGSVRVAGEGPHTLHYAARDIAGNIEPTKTLDIRLDPAPPQLHVVDRPHGGGYDRAGPVSFRATDDTSQIDSVYWKRETGGWNRMLGANLTLNITAGEHSLAVYAVDVAGSPSAMFTRTYRADATPPTLTTSAPTLALPGATLHAAPDGRVALAGTANDTEAGIDRVEVYLDGVAQIVTGAETWSTSFQAPPGHHTLDIIAHDRVGHTTTHTWTLVAGPR